jgi:predicted transcriptional regulator
MSSIQEIRTAIAKLNPRDKVLLAAELFATSDITDDAELDTALQQGLKDVEAGRVRPIEEIKPMIPRWTSKS